MYNFKEKNKHLRELHAPVHVSRDLELLKKLDPRNDQIPTFEHAPVRHAEQILYVLLDVASAEDVRNNRRNADLEAEKEVQDRLAKEAAEKEEQDRLAKEAAEKEEQDRLAKLTPTQDVEEKLPVDSPEELQAGDPSELETQNSELVEQLENTEFERDEAIEVKEELVEKLDEVEAELEDVKADLEAEKKSEPTPEVKKTVSQKAPASEAPSSKKKTSTRKSTGKTSKTKTSR
jgi:hypothetical protein